MHSFAFSGEVDDVILLTLSGPFFSGGAVPQATLFPPNGGAALERWNGTAQRQVTLPAAGVYVLTVQANNLLGVGSYSVGLERVDPVGPLDGTLAPGDLLMGTIDDFRGRSQ